MKTSKSGVEYIASKEGCRLRAYRNEGEKFYTIGYGHYGADVKATDVITKERALELLAKDLASRESFLNGCNFLNLTQNKFDALMSFIYNRGEGNFKKTRLYKHLKQADYKKAREDFLDPENWNFSKLSISMRKGLYLRRIEEQNTFTK